MRKTIWVLNVAMLTCAAAAQVSSDSFFLLERAGYLFSMHTGISMVAVPGQIASNIATAGNGLVFLSYRDVTSNTTYNIAQLDFSPGPFVGLTTVVPPLFGAPVLATTEERVWAFGASGDFASVARGIWLQPMTIHGNVYPAAGSIGAIRSAASNGRDVFFSTIDNIFAVDTELPFAVRNILSGTYPATYVSDIMIGPNGTVMFIGTVGSLSGVIAVDPTSGGMALLLPASQLAGGGIETAYNPWTDVLVTTDYSIWSRQISAPLGAPWQVILWNPMNAYSIADVATNAEPPFLLKGHGCPNATGQEPRLGWSGLPRQGGSFDLRLRNAEPSGFVVFWFGTSSSFSSLVGTLPYDAGLLGAPGCRMLASADFTLLLPVDAQGQAVLSSLVPVDPAIAGFKLFAQTVSSSGANALGLAASESVVIRFR